MMRYKNALLIVLVVLLAAVPLLMNNHAEFSGADVQAKDAINEAQPDYQPWFNPVWEPPSGEIETFIFALQAALGAGFIGYFLGTTRMIKLMNDKKREV